MVGELVDEMVVVREEEMRKSMIGLIEGNKVVREGGGGVGCGGLLRGKLEEYIEKRKRVSIIWGGNMDVCGVCEMRGLVEG